MPEYDIAFGKKLAETARMVAAENCDTLDAKRTVLYLGLLSAEITLKAMLEHAGKPILDIRARSHRLADLLSDLDQCEVEIEIFPGTRHYQSASRLRSCPIEIGPEQTTVGKVIDAENIGASIYPNQIRYGDTLRHFSIEVVVPMASSILKFANEHWNSLRVKKDQVIDTWPSDEAYLSWAHSHPGGYVLTSDKNLSPSHTVIHRASCNKITILQGNAKPGGFTERDYIKVCSESQQRLEAWLSRKKPNGKARECIFCLKSK